MKVSKGMLRMVVAGILVTMGASLATLTVNAQFFRRHALVHFGLTGITRGQIARLSVTNDPLTGFPPGPCRVTLSFVDAAGRPLTNAEGGTVSSTVTVDPGHSDVLDLDAGAFLGSVDRSRLDVRPIAAPPVGFPPGPCVPSFEVIDTKSSSTVFMNPGVASAALTNNHNETLVEDRE